MTPEREKEIREWYADWKPRGKPKTYVAEITVWVGDLLAALDECRQERDQLNAFLAEHGDPRSLRAEVAECRQERARLKGYVKDWDTDHATLRARAEAAEKALRDVIGSAGHPDPATAARNVIAIAAEALAAAGSEEA